MFTIFAMKVIHLISLGSLLFLPYTLAWWKNMIMYQIYVRSFKDTNGDGIGDLNGITQNIDHFVDLGIDAIYISPFYKSPMVDMGYDISNFTDIDPLFGTMADFDRLMAAAKERRVKVIADLVINHSSEKHPWFQKSIECIEPYKDYYVWADPNGYDENGQPLPPNNWFSMFGGSAWEWNNKRKQFYFHNFWAKQPDLNLRNEIVKEEIRKIIKFWLDKGIAGFRLDAPAQYMEDVFLRDEPRRNPNKVPTTRSDLLNIYTHNIKDSYTFTHQIRQYVDNYNKMLPIDDERILIAETFELEDSIAYYDRPGYNITHFPFNFDLAWMTEVLPAQEYNHLITSWLKSMPPGAAANWMAENHDLSRVDQKFGEEYIDIMLFSVMTLPGIAGIYYGQEIGMRSPKLRKDQIIDAIPFAPQQTYYRDGSRLPMQWDDTLNAGFSSNSKTWLPVHPNYWIVNVKRQKIVEYSRYNMFKILSNLRKSETMKRGDFTPYIISTWVYSYVRSCEKCQTYIIILNLGTESEFFNLQDIITNHPKELKVVAASQNAGYEPGDKFRGVLKFPHIFMIRPSSAIVLQEETSWNFKKI